MHQPEKEKTVVTRRGSVARVIALSCALLMGTSLATTATGYVANTAKASSAYSQASHAKMDGIDDEDGYGYGKGGYGYGGKEDGFFDEKGAHGFFNDGKDDFFFFHRCDRRRDFEGRDGFGFPFFFGDGGRRNEHRFDDRVNRPTHCTLSRDTKVSVQKARVKQHQTQDVEVKQKVKVHR